MTLALRRAPQIAKGLSLAASALLSWLCRPLGPRTAESAPIDDLRHLEDRQEHTDHHRADGHAQKDDENGLNEGRQTREDGLNFLVQEVGDTLEHVVHFARLFTGGNHANYHRREYGMFAQGHRNAFAPLDVAGGYFDGFLHDNVAHGLRRDLQHFQYRNAAPDQRRKGAREPGQANLVGNVPEDRQFDASRIPEGPAGRSLEEIKPAIDGPAAGDEQQHEILLHEMAEPDQILRRRRQGRAETGENLPEHRDDLYEQENRDHDCDDGYHGGIHHRRFDLFTEAGRVFQIDREARENFGEQTAFLAGGHHAHVKSVKGHRVLLECLRQAVTTLDPAANILNDVPHQLVAGLVCQGLQGL